LWERLSRLRTVPLELTQQDTELYYEGFSNGVLWPLLHYQLDRLPLEPVGWETYQQVNRAFADQVVASYKPGDFIWVHDYHLMLVPGLVRRVLPHATIGFFCHVPFPSSEVFRVLRQRRELLEGLLGSTLIGFHTAG
jgi:trehalose 6-phosphate synthase/phosphatase